MAPTPIDQDVCFYYGPWTVFGETIVLLELVDEIENGRWVRGDLARNQASIIPFLIKLRGEPWGMQMRRSHLRSKLWEWQARYNIFKSLIDDPRTVYDRLGHKIIATDDVWDQLHAEQPLNCWYMARGETNWLLIKAIFGDGDHN